MVVIYGMIFNVDLKKNRKFLQKEEILLEKNGRMAEQEQFKARFEHIQAREKQLRIRIIQERGVQDQAVLSEYPEYQQVMREAKEINETVESTNYLL